MDNRLKQDLDRWLTTPPEEHEKTERCKYCGNQIYPQTFEVQNPTDTYTIWEDTDGNEVCKARTGDALEHEPVQQEPIFEDHSAEDAANDELYQQEIDEARLSEQIDADMEARNDVDLPSSDFSFGGGESGGGGAGGDF